MTIADLDWIALTWQKDIMYGRAEVQTMNRRVTEERNKASEFAITSFARSLLSTSDVLTTALSLVKQPMDESNTALKELYSGVEMTQKQMLNTFSHHGVKQFEKTIGEKFDPNMHEAVFQVPKEHVGQKPGGGAYEAGEVFEVQKEGWMIGNRVLRPAQVGVTQME
jgi:molecular chaperone GrpE